MIFRMIETRDTKKEVSILEVDLDLLTDKDLVETLKAFNFIFYDKTICFEYQNGLYLDKVTVIRQIEEYMKERKQKQITKNLVIIKECLRQSNAQNDFRSDIAIFRLYRFCDLRPKEISQLTGLNIDTIQKVIGRTFKGLCLANDNCIFKQYLSSRKLSSFASLAVSGSEEK